VNYAQYSNHCIIKKNDDILKGQRDLANDASKRAGEPLFESPPKSYNDGTIPYEEWHNHHAHWVTSMASLAPTRAMLS
jgi:hypothetical protein